MPSKSMPGAFVKVFLFICALTNVARAVQHAIGVNYDPILGSYEVREGLDPHQETGNNFNARGSILKGEMSAGGWNYLDMIATKDDLQHYKALGFVEGYLSCEEIRAFYKNFLGSAFGVGEVPGEKTVGFLVENYLWMKGEVDMHPEDVYWQTINKHIHQIEGLLDGYKSGCVPSSSANKDSLNTKKFSATTSKGGPGVTNTLTAPAPELMLSLDEPTLAHFLLINAWGDLYQIAKKWREGIAMNFRGSRSPKSKLLRAKNGDSNEGKIPVEHCSAIFKLTDNFADVVFGHNTWDAYDSLAPRIIKRKAVADVHDVSFSSSPALLSSIDDFFMMTNNQNTHLTVIETTNNLYNLKLLDLVVPSTVLSWMRAITSNKLATSGKEWAEIFARYHSGTYTNQWMVLDLAKFTPGVEPKPDFFTVFEEVPGYYMIADQTSALVKDTYWASYNVPFYPEITKESGYGVACKTDITRCHDTCPRANIFRANQASIHDVAGGQMVMDLNDFQTNPLSLNSSCDAIACRGDLEPKELTRGGFGALDAKVSSVTTFLNHIQQGKQAPLFFARLGPTHQQQPVFCWSQLAEQDNEYSHLLQPECFDFDWTAFPASK